MQKQRPTRNRWFIVVVFFAFMLLHQTDRNLIGPLTTPIMETFNINEARMGAVSTFALLVGAILYPVWGYLYDRYARTKLLALASFLWGLTTTLNASARTYSTFLVTRGSTGIDDSSYPGVYSLVSDYFSPRTRGKIYGLLALAGPIGYLIAMILGVLMSEQLGWRNIFYITGGLGIVVAIFIFFGVKEPKRGESEPELEKTEIKETSFSWANVRMLPQKKSLIFLLVQGFFSVFPYMVITYWFFRYMETERGFDPDTVFTIMLGATLCMALGFFVGGSLGDYLFKFTKRGRLIVSTCGMFLSLVFINIGMRMPLEQVIPYGIFTILTGFCMALSNPNVTSTISDVTVPEVRSTAQAVQLFVENIGSAIAPFLAGLIAVRTNLQTAILIIATAGWVISVVFFALAAKFVPQDINEKHQLLEARAREEMTSQQ